ncbi:MAG: cell division protein FtsN [Saprospiraceae bacterium]|jgi:cell division protein FtsN|tara:strand:+ start:1494 stop:2087 length:594 start_codon:yes stop_codon:yes gene_type:complete
MGRFLKIAVYIAVLFLGYLWIATVAKSCNKTTSANNDDTELVDDIAIEDEFADDFFEDETEESDKSLDEMGGGSTTEVNSDLMDSSPMDYTEVDEIIEENKPTKQIHSAPIKQSTAKSTSSSDKYLLLAGSYLIEDNASTMVQKLKKMGYNNAEVVVFDMSQYHSVCAGRYSNMSSAKQESSSLKRKGVDNYVHTRQ